LAERPLALRRLQPRQQLAQLALAPGRLPRLSLRNDERRRDDLLPGAHAPPPSETNPASAQALSGSSRSPSHSPNSVSGRPQPPPRATPPPPPPPPAVAAHPLPALVPPDRDHLLEDHREPLQPRILRQRGGKRFRRGADAGIAPGGRQRPRRGEAALDERAE